MPKKEKKGQKSENQKQSHGDKGEFSCPDCGATLRHVEGCVMCPFCGWSKCG